MAGRAGCRLYRDRQVHRQHRVVCEVEEGGGVIDNLEAWISTQDVIYAAPALGTVECERRRALWSSPIEHVLLHLLTQLDEPRCSRALLTVLTLPAQLNVSNPGGPCPTPAVKITAGKGEIGCGGGGKDGCNFLLGLPIINISTV